MSEKYYKIVNELFKTDLNYRRGRNFEHSVMKCLRKRGWYCKRSFGSQGVEDIVAYKNGVGLLIQCKWSKYGETKPEQYDLGGLIALARRVGADPVFAGVRKHRMYFWDLINDREFKP